MLGQIKTEDLEERLEGVAAEQLAEKQQEYFCDLFLPQLYDSLPIHSRLGLSRWAVVELPVPIEGVASVSGFNKAECVTKLSNWIAAGLAQRFDDNEDDSPLYAIYPLLRDFLTAPTRLSPDQLHLAHSAAAEFFQNRFEGERSGSSLPSIPLELTACYLHALHAGDGERIIKATEWYSRLCNAIGNSSLGWKIVEATLSFLPEDARLHNEAGMTLMHLNRHDEAREHFEQALVEYQESDETRMTLLANLATVEMEQQNYSEAQVRYNQAAALAKQLHNRDGEATCCHNLADLAYRQGDYTAARREFERTLALIGSDQRSLRAATLHALGNIDLHEKNFANAKERYEASLRIREHSINRHRHGSTLAMLGWIELKLGNYTEAKRYLREAIAMQDETDDQPEAAVTLSMIGILAWNRDITECGIRLAAISAMLLQLTKSWKAKEAIESLGLMAGALGMNDVELTNLCCEVAVHYRDGGYADLVAQAFEGL